MNASHAILKFLENPISLYDAPEKFTPQEKRAVYALEEQLAAVLLSGMTMPDPNPEGEARNAAPAKIMQSRADDLLMKNPSLPTRSIPQALLGIVRKTGAVSETQSPDFIVRLAAGGLNIIKSTFRGYIEEPLALSATRAPQEVQERSRAFVRHASAGGDGRQIRMIRDANDSVTLAVHFTKNIPERLQALLMQEDRLIDSRVLPRGENSIYFNSLTPGRYRLKLGGDITDTTDITILQEDSA